jgi:hypothetical protein
MVCLIYFFGLSWDEYVTRDGKRFLLYTTGVGSGSAQVLNVVMNWDAGRRNDRRDYRARSTGRKWHLSTTGGEEPYWRRDGKELFYVAGK